MSWFLDEEKLLNINDCYAREPYPFIAAHYVYLNDNDYIDNIVCEDIYFNWDASKNIGVIPNNKILKLIEEKKNGCQNKYSFDSGATFIITLEPDDIHSYSETDDNDSRFLKPFTIINDLHLEPSIFIFNNLNAIYFFFRQTEKKNNPTSILKIMNTPVIKKIKSKTKRVRVKLPTKKNRTRKYLEK